MSNLVKFVTGCILLVFMHISNANTLQITSSRLSNNFTQSIHILNLLANTSLTDAGMTPTPIILKYYNGGSFPCWSNILEFKQDITIHAGPTQGCRNKVNQIVIMPAMVADKLKTYRGPVSVDIDPNVYSTHVTVIQSTSPLFNTENGLVTQAGSVIVQTKTD